MMRGLILVLAGCLMGVPVLAQVQKPVVSSSSTTGANGTNQVKESTSGPGRGAEAAGGGVTLETSEALFDVAVALNACGYDRDLEDSLPVRGEVRAEVERAARETPAVNAARAAMCLYIHDHELADKGRDIAQYISLALYLTPPPELAPVVEEVELPPDALQVVNLLPLLRTFAKAMVLHELWQRHRPEYEAVTAGIHDRMTQMLLDTNVYLRLPVSGYDGRRFLILMEPMLSPKDQNGRIYATDYIIVESEGAKGEVRFDQIRHIYLQYVIDPLIYSRASSMDRLLPLLKPIQGAPLEFAYRSDMTLYLTECLIKAVETRTMDVGFAKPQRPPTGTKDRQELSRYETELTAYERNAEEVRRRTVDLRMREGWALTNYFYDQLARMEHDGIGLKDNIAEMVYGMDVQHELKEESDVAFLPKTTVNGDFVKRAPRPLTPMMQAEKKMLEGDVDGAREIAVRALEDPKQDHAEANYVLARVQLMENEPATSLDTFAAVIRETNNAHTLAWAHIYRGRLFDTQNVPNRARAVAEYRAALAVPGVSPDARYAAQDGLKQAYVLPKRVVHEEEDMDGPLDPTGKAAKEAYKPDAEK